MIIGNGFIAQNFQNKIKIIKKLKLAIFASGVSNSLTFNNYDFLREKKKIANYKNKINNKTLVYISSCGVFDPSRNQKPYFTHKLEMENLVKTNFKKFIIIRLPEIIGLSLNKNNLVNFLYDKIKNDKKFTLYFNSKRNILDINDAITLSLACIEKKMNKKKINFEINVANRKFYLVSKIVSAIEVITLRKAKFVKKKISNSNWRFTNSIDRKLIKRLNIQFNKFYLNNVIKKYYS